MIPGQPHRLQPNHGFAAAAIDRARPLAFQLNGQAVFGFDGDTVLSAVLALGVTEAGIRAGQPLALDEAFAPDVLPAEGAGTARPLPMARAPAIDGADLVTVGPLTRRYFSSAPAVRLRHFLAGPRRTLGHSFDHPSRTNVVLSSQATEHVTSDVVVVGGGIAGLSAALAAGSSGERVVLVERRPYVGGDAPFFPVTEGELAPDDALQVLSEQLALLPNVQILTRAEATTVRGTTVFVHQVAVDEGLPRSRDLEISAERIVLATGSIERLPVFPGNRSPRVTGTLAAFHRAQRYGVWLGRRAIFSTVANPAYRLPIRAAEAGIEVQRIVDIRGQVVSRFIDFAKASGIQLSLGSIPYAAQPPGQGLAGVYAHFAVTFDGRPTGEPVWTEQLVLSGSWQPALDLWIAAGGACQWSRERNRLEAAGELANIALAGGAAGFTSTTACARSGEAAVARLYSHQPLEVCDPEPDTAYETPASVFPPIRPGVGIRARPAYLDSGPGLVSIRPPQRINRPPTGPSPTLADHPGVLTLGAIATAVELGELKPADAAKIATERCIPPLTLTPPEARPEAPQSAPSVPGFLAGRFGDTPQLWLIEPTEARVLGVGALIYHHAETTDPAEAIGVVVSHPKSGSGAVALLGKVMVATGDRLTVREPTSAHPIRVAERIETAAA